MWEGSHLSKPLPKFEVCPVGAMRILAWRARLPRLRRSGAVRCVVIPSSLPGSKGEEAIVQGAMDGLFERGHTRLVFVEYHPVKTWPHFSGNCLRWDLVPSWLRRYAGFFGRFWQQNQTTHHDNVFGQGFSGEARPLKPACSRITRRSVLSNLKSSVANRLRLWFDLFLLYRLVGFLAPGDKVFVVGADVLDGAYTRRLSEQMLAFAQVAALRGCQVRILGFSVRPNANPDVMEQFPLMDRRIRYLVRDPNSLRRFMDMTGCVATLVADAAFMLKPKSSLLTERVAMWIGDQRKRSAVVVAFNCNPVLVNGQDNCDVTSVYCRLILAIKSKMPGTSFVLVPHSSIEHEEELVSHVAVKLVRDGVDVLALPLVSAAEVKCIMGLVDFCITGRMHVAIATLGMRVPVTGLSYGGKFEGLFSGFGIEESVMDPRELTNTEAFSEKLSVLIGRRDALKSRIEANALAMFAKAQLNIEDAEL